LNLTAFREDSCGLRVRSVFSRLRAFCIEHANGALELDMEIILEAGDAAATTRGF
jgi:hypothetical protein